jgi:phage portal protein BeeE
VQKQKWYTKILNRREDRQVKAIQYDLKRLQDELEQNSLDRELSLIEKTLDGDTESSSRNGDFSGIEEEISRGQLQKLFMTETWFYICVVTIAKTIAALPPKLEQKRKVTTTTYDAMMNPQQVDRVAYVDASGEPEMSLFEFPNDIQPAIEFYMLLIIDLLATGEAFIYVDKGDHVSTPNTPIQRMQDVNKPTDVEALYRISSPLMEPIASEDGKFLAGWGLQTQHGYFTFAPEEIIQLKMPNPGNPFHGLSPITAVLKNVLIDRYTKEHMIRFYKQGARLGGVVKTDQKLTKEQITRLERTFEQNYTGRQNHHRTIVLPSGMSYETVEANPGETSLIEFMKNNKEPILAAFNVPPVKIGIMDGATFANALVQQKIFFTDTIMPILSIIEQYINLHPSILKAERKLKFSFDLSKVEALQDNLKDMADIAKTMMDGGLTVNEVRQRIWKAAPITGGNKSKVVADMGQVGIFGPKSAQPVEEKTDAANAQNDQERINSEVETRCTFEERVAELAAASIEAGVDMVQALMMATLQAITEGFVPGAPSEKKTEEVVAASAEQLVEAPKEVVVEAAAEATGPKDIIPGWSKERVVAHWKTMAGEGTDHLHKQMDEHIQSMFSRLEKIFLKGLHKALKNRGLMSKAAADDEADESELADFIKSESGNLTEAMKNAMKYGYDQTLLEFTMNFPNEEAQKMLDKVAMQHVKSIVGTTKDQVGEIIKDAYADQVSVGEMTSRIRDKFAEISEGRAKTIVRTETLTAVSLGQDLKAKSFQKDTGKTLMKKWMSAQDDKVRDSHEEMDASPAIPYDEEYDNGLMFPRDPSAKDAGEVINCRCTQIEFVPEDQDDIEDITENTDLLPNEGNNWLGEGEPKE